MALKERLKSIILAIDFIISLLVFGLVVYISPDNLLNEFTKDVYNVGITVLSIVFSVYFAALAIIISSSDNDFIDFLDEEGDYIRLIQNFRFALAILFFALLYSIFVYVFTVIWFYNKQSDQPKWLFSFFSFMAIYGLLATVSATNDAIKFAMYRAKFLKRIRERKKKNQDSN